MDVRSGQVVDDTVQLARSDARESGEWNVGKPKFTFVRIAAIWVCSRSFCAPFYTSPHVQVGSIFYAAILVKYAGILSAAPYHDYVIHFANLKMVTPEWHQIFLKGIGCNVLVCIAVWQASQCFKHALQRPVGPNIRYTPTD